MTRTVKVPDSVYREAKELAERYEYSMKEAIRHMCREGGYDV